MGDARKERYGKQMVQAYTDQMNESNPILTAIAEGMTAEGKANDGLLSAKNDEERNKFLEEKRKWEAFKEEENAKLKACSAKWNSALREIREEYGRTMGVSGHGNSRRDTRQGTAHCS